MTTPEATIHYTTNGAAPSIDDPVFPSGGQVTVDEGRTLKAIAVRDDLAPSDVAVASS